MKSLSNTLAAMGIMAISGGNRPSIDELSPEKWLFDATGNDGIRSGNTLSQKGRRKRQRQYLSQSFRKGK